MRKTARMNTLKRENSKKEDSQTLGKEVRGVPKGYWSTT